MSTTIRYRIPTWARPLPLLAVAALAAACGDPLPTGTALGAVLPGARRVAGGVSGASFTSTNIAVDGAGVCRNGQQGSNANNCNIYTAMPYVWIEGGPIAASLGDGTYFFAVLVPGGQNNDVNDASAPGTTLNKNLSDDIDAASMRAFTVSGGQITGMLDPASTHAFDAAEHRIRLFPYLPTTNPGGEYDVAVCAITAANGVFSYTVNPQNCKYDNFKVREGEATDNRYGALYADKFFDANANGMRDASEQPIVGWPVTLNEMLPSASATRLTLASWLDMNAGTYSMTEGIPVQAANWFISYKGAASGALGDNLLYNSGTSTLGSVRLSSATTGDRTIPNIVLGAGGSESRLFGNYCLVPVGGWTLGFWSNQNGGGVLYANDQAWRTLLNGYTLYRANGTIYQVPTGDFSKPAWPATVSKLSGGAFTDFRSWLLGANSSSTTAAGAKYMLSVQMAAMLLNVNYGYQGSTVDVNAWYPPYGGTIGSLLAAAQYALANPAYYPSGYDSARAYQLALKTHIDALNNKAGAVPTTQDGCGAYTFP